MNILILHKTLSYFAFLRKMKIIHIVITDCKVSTFLESINFVCVLERNCGVCGLGRKRERKREREREREIKRDRERDRERAKIGEC